MQLFENDSLKELFSKTDMTITCLGFKIYEGKLSDFVKKVIEINKIIKIIKDIQNANRQP